jgi:hypothetical protein
MSKKFSVDSVRFLVLNYIHRNTEMSAVPPSDVIDAVVKNLKAFLAHLNFVIDS